MVSKILRADGTTELASIQTVTYHESVNADTDLRPGCVASSYIEVTCFGAQSDAPDVGEALTYYQVVGETETLIGIFYAEPSIPTKNSYSFIAYDAVHKLDADFSTWLSAHQEDFPYTVYQLVSQACTISGVTLGTSAWDHSTMEVNAWYADGLTCRNILQYAAEIACKFVRCNTSGQIVFGWYSAVSNQRIYPSSGTSGSETRYAYKQDGLTYDNYDTSALARVAVHPVGEDEVAYYYPTNVTSGNTLNVTNNALLYGASAENMTAIAQSIYTTMTAFGTYRPMTVEMFPNECPFGCGDIVPVTDAQGVSFTTVVMEKTVTDSAVTLTSTGREVYGDYALDTAKQLVQLAADIVRINKLKVGWAEIDEAVVGVLTSHGMNPDEVVVSANTVTEYYLSTSSSSATGGSWGTSIPTWSSGKYVWTRDKTTNEYADGTSSTSYSPSQNGVYDANLTTALSTAASASSAASTAQSTANGANAREQTIYISKASGTSSVSANTTWVTDATGNQNTWTTKRPVYNSSYPVLFIAQQRQTVTQYNGGSGTGCSCTTPVKDDTTTVIDGGHITTGTIDASRVNVTNINASNITTGALTVKDASNNIIFQADATNKTARIGDWVASASELQSTDTSSTVLHLGQGELYFDSSQSYVNDKIGIYTNPYEQAGTHYKGLYMYMLLNGKGKANYISGFSINYLDTNSQMQPLLNITASTGEVGITSYAKVRLTSDLDVNGAFKHTGATVSITDASAWRTALGVAPRIDNTGIKKVSGQGQNNYFKIATITITGAYVNRTIAFKLSGRGKRLTTLNVRFASVNGTDPPLELFSTDVDDTYYMRKYATSTWELYGQYNETWGDAILHSIEGSWDGNTTITVNMTNAGTTEPSNSTRASWHSTTNLTISKSSPSNIYLKNWSINAGTAPSSDLGAGVISFLENGNKNLSQIYSYYTTSKMSYIRMIAYNYVGSTSYNNFFDIRVNADGTPAVYISQPAAWRSALGLGTPITIANGGTGQTGVTTTSTVSQIISLGSGWSASLAQFATWGKIGMLRLNVSRSTAQSSAAEVTVGTLVTGKRPVINTGGTRPNDPNKTVYITSAGVVSVYGSFAANATIAIVATFILA